jgi:hypothetical protein
MEARNLSRDRGIAAKSDRIDGLVRLSRSEIKDGLTQRTVSLRLASPREISNERKFGPDVRVT